MAQDVSNFLIERLHAWGVHRIFGYPGDGANGLLGALRAQGDKVAFVQARHEELAAFMACAHAKFTGELGVCLATSGPGAIHLLNGLYDARLDNQPVLALVGQQARASLGGEAQQEVDLVTLFKDVTEGHVHMATVPEQVRHLVDRAVRAALARRGVSCLVVPNDLQRLDAVAQPPREHGMLHSSVGAPVSRPIPPPAALQAAADVLNAGSRVAILVGAGAQGATTEVLEVADLLGAGIAKALLGKDVVPDDLPHVTGSIGMLGTDASWYMMEHCDTLLMVGSNFPYAEFLPAEGKARGVQIDIDPVRLGMRYPMEQHLAGDAVATLRALAPLLRPRSDASWRERIASEVAKWWTTLDERAHAAADPINPQLVFHALSERLPDQCIVTGDSGSSAFWYARHLKLRSGMRASLSGGLATMGSALPYGIAAKLAHPGRPVVALLGDGAMQMLGINALITLADMWRRWDDSRFTVMVLNNGDLNMVTWEQRVTEGDPRFEASQRLPAFAYADYARMLGLNGIRVDRPEQVGPAWDQALASPVPTLLEMVTDPEVPPLPPHVTAAQARSYLSALLHGDRNVMRQIAATVKELWAGRR